MKHFKLISILCVALGVSAANAAETTINGEFFGNFTYDLDNGEAGGNDVTTGYGFNLDRARVSATHAFNDTWSVTLKVDAADTTSGNSFDAAFVTGKNWLADGHTMMFGLQANAYRRMWDANNARWIHADLTSGSVSDLNTYFGIANSAHVNDYNGLNYNIALNDMWQVEFSLNNGGNESQTRDSMGYGLTVMGKFNDQVSLLVGYDNATDYNSTANDDADSDTSGLTALRASLFYTSDMVDAGFEYAMWDYNENDGVAAAVDGVSAMAVNATWKYAEARGVFAKYAMYDSDYSDNIGTESEMTLGHTWMLEKGVNTGVFYTATSNDNSDNDSSAIVWKWAASF
ncbi:MAG: hypothetical protein KDD37_07915 [Bdellovibrionales bacterium]|nr:hypothetical protein [Bdellovibrionales bacterium]